MLCMLQKMYTIHWIIFLPGLVFDFLGNAASAIFIGAWNVISVIFEHFLMMDIYKNHPALRDKVIPESKAFIERLDIIEAGSSSYPLKHVLKLIS